MNFSKRFALIALVVGCATLAIAAIPKTTAILHVSPETWEGASAVLKFNGTTAPTINAANIATTHVPSDAGTAPLAIETRVITMSSNTATYTFATAFSYAPICTCGDTTTTTPVACSANAATATQVVIYSIGAAAVVNVICVGAR